MKKIFFSCLMGASLCTFSINAEAQTKKQTKDSSVVIIFSETTTPSQTKKVRSSENNIVKISPLGFLTGRFPLSFERRITDFLAIEASGGVTNKNYIRSIFAQEANIKYQYPWANDSYYDESEPLYQFDERKPKMGVMYGIQPKIYFESEAPEGSFLGLSYDVIKYKFEVPSYSGGVKEEFENVNDFMVNFGYNRIFDRISLETSSGIGLRKVKGEKYVVYKGGSSITDGMATYQQSTINIALGIKVGYHF